MCLFYSMFMFKRACCLIIIFNFNVIIFYLAYLINCTNYLLKTHFMCCLFVIIVYNLLLNKSNKIFPIPNLIYFVIFY